MQKNRDIVQKQDENLSHDIIDGHIIPVHNIFDKGYCVNLMTQRHGRQGVERPVFAYCDLKFTGIETLKSVSIATYRSGKERGVKMTKISVV